MKIIAIEKELTAFPEKEYRALLKEEAKCVWELYKEGFVREIYFTTKDHRAVLILECKDYPEAERLLGNLPLVKENIIAFDILPLEPYNGFERLFEKDL